MRKIVLYVYFTMISYIGTLVGAVYVVTELVKPLGEVVELIAGLAAMVTVSAIFVFLIIRFIKKMG